MGPSALSALTSLASQFNVVGIVREVSKSTADDGEVMQCSDQLQIPIFSDVSIPGVESALTETQPDCVVVCSYNRILGPRILMRAKFVNVHYSLLPEYRGRAPINWALLNGEHATAITIHCISPDLDAGNILYQQAIKIGPADTASRVFSVLDGILREVLGDTVARHIDGYSGEPQDESSSSYGCTRVPEDGDINWSESTERIYAQIRSLGPPWPRAYTYLGTLRITVVRASPVEDAPRYVGRIPGRVVNRSRAGGFVDVLTGDGVLRIHEVMVGDSMVKMAASAAVTSTRQTVGLRATDLLARLEELERRLDRLTTLRGGEGDRSAELRLP
jgi:methionyl-tRNA formyltransferase